MKQKQYQYYSIFTILLFSLGIFNIIFAWLGFICMITPFVILIRSGRNKWCQKYCPRANLFTVLFQKTKSKPVPNWLTKPWVKKVFLGYFLFNMLMLLLSTMMVFLGNIQSMEMVRFMMVFRMPWDLPQLITIPFFPSWAVHLSFRLYSMMFTTTTIGLILGFLYKPRTWCTICPVMTLSNMYLLKKKN